MEQDGHRSDEEQDGHTGVIRSGMDIGYTQLTSRKDALM